MSNVAKPYTNHHASVGQQAQPKDHLADHEYDGIREYDNPTPGWWHVFFLASVIFSFFYIIYMHGSPDAPTPFTRLDRMQVKEDQALFGSYSDLKPDQESMFRLMNDPKMMSVGASKFKSTCAQCHANDGGGGINAVNLCDDSYKNVKVMTDIFNVITNGAAAGAMPAWKVQFNEKERILLAAYVAHLRGTHPEKPKAPEGQTIPPWPTATTNPAAK